MYENEFLLTLRYFNTLNPTIDQHLISPYRNTAESLTEIMRIKEMIASLRSFDCKTNSPCQYQKKYIETIIEKIIENMDADVRI